MNDNWKKILEEFENLTPDERVAKREEYIERLFKSIEHLSTDVEGASSTALYSGRIEENIIKNVSTNDLAQDIAKQSGGKVRTIDNTELGRFLSSEEFINRVKEAFGNETEANNFLYGERDGSQLGIWDKASEKFVAETKTSKVFAITPNAGNTRVFTRTEIEALLNNPDVTQINGIDKAKVQSIYDDPKKGLRGVKDLFVTKTIFDLSKLNILKNNNDDKINFVLVDYLKANGIDIDLPNSEYELGRRAVVRSEFNKHIDSINDDIEIQIIKDGTIEIVNGKEHLNYLEEQRLQETVSSKKGLISEAIGEVSTELHMRSILGEEERNFQVLRADLLGDGKTGEFDQIYWTRDGEIYIVEAKGGRDYELGSREYNGQRVEQNTPEYKQAIINNMIERIKDYRQTDIYKNNPEYAEQVDGLIRTIQRIDLTEPTNIHSISIFQQVDNKDEIKPEAKITSYEQYSEEGLFRKSKSGKNQDGTYRYKYKSVNNIDVSSLDPFKLGISGLNNDLSDGNTHDNIIRTQRLQTLARGLRLLKGVGTALTVVDAFVTLDTAIEQYQNGDEEASIETLSDFLESAIVSESAGYASFVLAAGLLATLGAPGVVVVGGAFLAAAGASYLAEKYGSDLFDLEPLVGLIYDTPSALSALYQSLSDLFEQASSIVSPLVLVDPAGERGLFPTLEDIALEDSGVEYNLYGDQDNPVIVPTGWISPNEAFLVLDRNDNSQIDSLFELFGSVSHANGDASPNGFATLSEYDSNKDLVIDNKDEVYKSLQLWQDRNQDGISQENELSGLADSNIVSINASGIPINRFLQETKAGNFISHKNTYKRADGSTGEIVDVWFRTNGKAAIHTGDYELDLDVFNLPLHRAVGVLPSFPRIASQNPEFKAALQEIDIFPTNDSVDRLLYLWAGVDNIDPDYRNFFDVANIDARKVYFLEHFFGFSYKNFNNIGPNQAAALEDIYEKVRSEITLQLAPQTEFLGEVLPEGAYDYFADEIYLDVTGY